MASAPTLRIRRSAERGFEDFGWTDNWMTFSFGGYHSREWNNFGPLRVIVENHPRLCGARCLTFRDLLLSERFIKLGRHFQTFRLLEWVVLHPVRTLLNLY